MSEQVPGPGVPWWRDAVCYEVYVRSFADADGDGFGDLPGITDRLEHLADLGVDALWITPFYPSPQHDHGYDVADYRDVEPTYGDLAAFDALAAKAHGLGLKVIVDVVPNHTSWDHEWFRAALAGDEQARARYLFRPGRGDGSEPPNNWLSVFGGGAWEPVPGEPGTWYLHLFDRSQPDLDWTNPEVGDDLEHTLRFWLDRGADGFRVDVAHGLVKAEGLPDVEGDPMAYAGGTVPGGPMWDQDGVHEVYRRWRRVLDSYPGDRMAVGEAWAPTPERTARYVRPDELQQSFNFHFLTADFTATDFREVVELTLSTLEPVGADATWVLANHDVVRPPTRYGGGERGLARTRAATMVMLALPGSAYLYQGEELGLEQVEVAEEDKQDPEYLNGRGPGRDGCRVPIPWDGDSAPYAFGPGAGQPWLPQPEEYADLSVAAQRSDPDSTLAFYRSALRTRRGLLAEGWAQDRGIEFLDVGPDVLGFVRGEVSVLVNMSEDPIALPAMEVVLASEPVADELPPDAAVWLRPHA
ncbi:alpha-glucosidase [Marmoricola endophyticus]|uniref:Alpha-glucosidase n=1 Tax=Marmoricola endophyticus TaxID=2040280 RepID=A0A917F4F6_9ACTN|nr:glycoside hydrolase family 13 protein [Marmoricola endophyticus]GGF41753.1 alpha-glucosidase [Marmoricola endophyticus]